MAAAGPDHFELMLQGPELLPLHAEVQHSGRCNHEMLFNITVPGRYHINMGFLRENYAGANELHDVWPPSHLDEPLETKVTKRFGDVAEAEFAVKRPHSRDRRPLCRLRPSVEELEDDTWYEALAAGRWVTNYVAGDVLWPIDIGPPPLVGGMVRGFEVRPMVTAGSRTNANWPNSALNRLGNVCKGRQSNFAVTHT